MELTVTHRVGPFGQAERYNRPDTVRSIADRMRRWTSTPESCTSCQARAAASLRDGLPLCGACRANFDQRRGLATDMLGRQPWPTRAGDLPSDKQLRGHAIVFNAKSVDLGGFVEIIRPSAADRMEAEHPDLRSLWNHDSAITLGRVTAGTLRARKVARGVAIEVDPPRWAYGHVESIDRRDITGMSFGFFALDDNWHLEEGEPVREVFDMVVVEVSPVSFPAYPQTDIAVVSANQRSSWQVERDTADRVRLAR